MIKNYINDLKSEFKGYNGATLGKDIMAGITVAAVALPLALAFGVSSGADAAAGLVTAILAGIIIGGLGGASYQISGPTGAMSAILISLSARYGMKGVLTAGIISGIILILCSLFRVGKLVSFIPMPVITGFTSGIAIVIALGQVDNFFGVKSSGDNAIEKIISYFKLGFDVNLAAVVFGLLVILIMVMYPKKWNAIVPSSLVGIVVALIVNLIINPDGTLVAEVGAIPKSLFTENSLVNTGLDLENITSLITPAISIAALGMIESLLCGASAGKMTGEKLDADRELLAQGVGNVVIPLFGGVPATAAIARTSVAIKSGGKTRLVSLFHSVTLILSMFILGGVMSRIPLSALAGVLMVTAWRMNEWDTIKNLFKKKLKMSIPQFVVTMVATVVFDLTIAIVIGVFAAMLLFVLKCCNIDVAVRDIEPHRLKGKGVSGDHRETKVCYVSGPLFFGSCDHLSKELKAEEDADVLVLSMRGVPLIDDSAINVLTEIYDDFQKMGRALLFCGVQDDVFGAMKRSGFVDKVGERIFFWDAVEAIKAVEAYQNNG